MMKKTILILILFISMSFASKSVIVNIQGDLDDDLFILKSTPKKVEFLDCFQMHNPTDKFFYDGKVIKSEKIYGLIDFNKSYNLTQNETLLVMSANEREEINSKRGLLQRTHFKSVDLYVNREVFIPSLMPEYDDIPNYPLWFGKDEKPLIPQKKSYNYYKLWENAIVNLGLIFGSRGDYTLYFINQKEQIIFKKEVQISSKSENIPLLGSHPLMEVDGTVFAGNFKDEKKIKEKAIDAIIIEKEGQKQYIKLPYLFPYINRIFVKGL